MVRTMDSVFSHTCPPYYSMTLNFVMGFHRKYLYHSQHTISKRAVNGDSVDQGVYHDRKQSCKTISGKTRSVHEAVLAVKTWLVIQLLSSSRATFAISLSSLLPTEHIASVSLRFSDGGEQSQCHYCFHTYRQGRRQQRKTAN
jgi:hypothetical protein